MIMKMPTDSIRFVINRIRERLWVKPLIICLLSIAGVFVAKFTDGTPLRMWVPEIKNDSIETLLSVLASSMLVIATFAVGSMVSAYNSASQTATPRSFALVVADDVSQNALSTFIGAFIFSIIGLITIKNEYFQVAGSFTLFVLTVLVFMIVILTFVRWVDRIARLGRMGMIIKKVENATADALKRRKTAPTLCALPISAKNKQEGKPIFASNVGYIQNINMEKLQSLAKKLGIKVVIEALPGAFVSPGRPLAYTYPAITEKDLNSIIDTFLIGDDRMFDDDPRFGLVVLSEIAGRAMSPAVNDPGTAIDILGSLVRLITLWHQHTGEIPPLKYDRIEAPQITVIDMFDDGFTAIARDGAATVEVAIRLQKALQSLSLIDDQEIKRAAQEHARLALARAEKTMLIAEDLSAVRNIAQLTTNSMEQ